MGHFIGPPGPIVSSGIFGPAAIAAATPQFMVVGSNTSNPNVGSACGASIRDASGKWTAVDVTALGARGAYGVLRDGVLLDRWYISTNPGGANAQIGVVVDFSSAATSVDTGLSNHLSDMARGNGLFNIATLDNVVITSPDMTLGSFTSHANHGPGSYTAVGMGCMGGDGQAVTVGLGSGGTGICSSPDSITWSQLATVFSTQSDSFVTANTIIWDGNQYAAVGQSKLATSPDGLTWTITSLAAVTTQATVIGYDIGNQTGPYVMGDRNGNVFVAATPVGLATASAVHLTSNPIRCATILAATLPGIILVGDSGGNIYSSIDGGVTWNTENPGLGALVLTALASTATP